jgi:cardiolipin synthase (CMP-forming)
VLRLVLAALFPSTLARGGPAALVLVVVAVATDYVDGPLARRSGRSTRHGALLDGGADVAFVVAAAGAGAAVGLVSWLVPAAMAGAGGVYLVASATRSVAAGHPARAYSAVGHAAGVCNYVLAGLVAGTAALPWRGWPAVLGIAGAGVAVLNLAALAQRIPWRSRARRARA